jgi:hypothetical protein
MPYPNRELSQFSTFLHVNDVTKTIGITTINNQYVGIGTTLPQQKLEVRGNIKADFYYGDGANLINVTTAGFSTNNQGTYNLSNVGIGTTAIPNKLTVRGTVGVSSVVSGYIFNSNAPNGIAPFSVQSNTLVSNLNAAFLQGRQPPTGAFVGTTDVQTLTNKTLITPIFVNTIINNASIPPFAPVSVTLSLPSSNGTIIHTGSSSAGIITGTLIADNTITGAKIANSTINYSKLSLSNSLTNSDISVTAGIEYAKLNLANSVRSSDIDINYRIENNKLRNSTISGVSLGNYLAQLLPGNHLSGSVTLPGPPITTSPLVEGAGYDGEYTVQFDVVGYSYNTRDTLVKRDTSGDFIGSTITAEVEFSGPGSIPVGGIIMWSGDWNSVAANYPEWKICNGQSIYINGVLTSTPDLREKFIMGVRGDGYSAVGLVNPLKEGGVSVTVGVNTYPVNVGVTTYIISSPASRMFYGLVFIMRGDPTPITPPLPPP